MLSTDKSCTRQAKPAPSQHPSYPLTSWSITLGVPPPTIPPQACLSDPAPSSHSPSSPHHTPSFPRSVCRPPSIPPVCARFPPPSTPPKSPSLPVTPLPLPLPLLQVFISPPALQSSRQPGERQRALSPWVADPCQGDKLPTVACLHSWKIKDLWGREGSVCPCVCACMCVIESEWGTHRSVRVWERKRYRWIGARALKVCAVFVCALRCVCVCVQDRVKQSCLERKHAADGCGCPAVTPSNGLMSITDFIQLTISSSLCLPLSD